jgi:tetratricopeptide (TPR) repeat protein
LNLTALDTPEPDLAYIFKHIITQEVTYNLMLYAQRRELHGAVAAWYEHHNADELALHYQLLAFHWGRVGDEAKTLDYLERAGEQALRAGVYREAAVFFSDALALNPAEGKVGAKFRRARWERQLADAYSGLGQAAQAIDHLREALELLNQSMPAVLGGLSAGALRQVLRQVWHRVWPGRLGRGSDDQKAVWLEAARSYAILGEIYFINNKALPAIYCAIRSLNLAEKTGPCPELVRGYATMAGAAALLPARRLARVYNRLAERTAQAVNDLSTFAWLLSTRSYFTLGMGQWKETRETVERATAIYDRLGDRRRWEQYSGLLACRRDTRALFQHRRIRILRPRGAAKICSPGDVLAARSIICRCRGAASNDIVRAALLA